MRSNLCRAGCEVGLAVVVPAAAKPGPGAEMLIIGRQTGSCCLCLSSASRRDARTGWRLRSLARRLHGGRGQRNSIQCASPTARKQARRVAMRRLDDAKRELKKLHTGEVRLHIPGRRKKTGLERGKASSGIEPSRMESRSDGSGGAEQAVLPWILRSFVS